MECLDLQVEWNSLATASGIEIGLAEHHFDTLCKAYSEPHRHYHTLDHISQMLLWLSDAGVKDSAVLWAAWYHDYVYNPGKKDNEALSATQADLTLSELGVDSSIVTRVVQMIEATKDHKVEGRVDHSVGLLLDADMAILGVPEYDYEQYCLAVRAEHKSIPGFLYRRGRKNFLESVLEQEKIYYSHWFYERFERRARINIEIELSRL